MVRSRPELSSPIPRNWGNSSPNSARLRPELSLALCRAVVGHTAASTRSQPLWLWFGLGVDELGAMLGFYSLDGLVWEWFHWCGNGWFDSVVVLCWLLGFYSFAWVWSLCSLIQWWWFWGFFSNGFNCVCLLGKFMGLKARFALLGIWVWGLVRIWV